MPKKASKPLQSRSKVHDVAKALQNAQEAEPGTVCIFSFN